MAPVGLNGFKGLQNQNRVRPFADLELVNMALGWNEKPESVQGQKRVA